MRFSKTGPNLHALVGETSSWRVIFLDFDGVLHPPSAIAGAKPPLRPSEIRRRWPLALQHLHILRKLLEGHADIAIVVSSSWRLFFSDVELGELLSPISAWYGGSIGRPNSGRADAIREWIGSNPIKDFAVLDDKQEYFPGPPDSWPTLILCDGELGLSEERVQQRLLEWLTKSR